MNTVNMSSELFDALEDFFKDDEEILVDCLLYLTSLRNEPGRVNQLSGLATFKLDQMNRCTNCGEKLQTYHYQEPHPELDGCPKEDRYEPYCPNCDVIGMR